MATADPTPRLDLSGPDLTEAELSAVAAVLDTRWLSLGPRLPEFERAVADYVGCRYAVAVNSGTSALHLIVRGLGLGEGDEVITTPFSFIASANCLLFERAVPKFVDIDPVTLNLDCDRIEGALTPRTKAILAVDVFGRPADWTRLRALADAHGLALIEDSCEALGARYRRADGSWAQAGSLGDAGCFAFYPNKQITTGEGGIIVTDNEELARLSRSMRNQGRDEGAEWLAHARLGYNYRLSDINCALGLAQMQRLEEILAARRQVAAWYGEALTDVEAVEIPPETPDTEISWFVYVVRLRGCEDRETLGRVIAGLRARGIGCSNYFAPIHLQPFYREQFGFQPGDFPVTEGVSTQTIALPFYNRLRQAEVARVAEELRQVIAEVLPGATAGVREAP
jgi:perosamine synthetase